MDQNYSNHRQFVPLYHYILFLLVAANLIGSFINLYKVAGTGSGLYSASLIAAMAVAVTLIFFLMRTFALKAQDRAIRAEENLRHYIMNGQLLDPKLSMRQVIGLRFASDEEFLELEKKAATESLSEDAIKKAVKNWKGDSYRV
jgi:hypothetical protein